MKNLILLTGLFLSMSLAAQEVTTYQEIDANLTKVMVYDGNTLKQEGFLKKSGNLWINTGVWRQYGNDGKLTLKVQYKNGRRVKLLAYRDNKVIEIYSKN